MRFIPFSVSSFGRVALKFQSIIIVETNPPLSPSPRGYPYMFDFRADQANKKGVSSS